MRSKEFVRAVEDMTNYLREKVDAIPDEESKVNLLQDVFLIVSAQNIARMKKKELDELRHILMYKGPGGFSVETMIDALSLFTAQQWAN
ncbi:hypothetical protein AGMMS49543_10630 [Betaproteobacteria bacterium]|nr:hypothetical protein AGMMS49543_10630 [Betaproteobacteria bacterium]GHU20060.1 hypothetical protein AGMMS50243_13590 [Betaproteobacteria bacterium]